VWSHHVVWFASYPSMVTTAWLVGTVFWFHLSAVMVRFTSNKDQTVCSSVVSLLPGYIFLSVKDVKIVKTLKSFLARILFANRPIYFKKRQKCVSTVPLSSFYMLEVERSTFERRTQKCGNRFSAVTPVYFKYRLQCSSSWCGYALHCSFPCCTLFFVARCKKSLRLKHEIQEKCNIPFCMNLGV